MNRSMILLLIIGLMFGATERIFAQDSIAQNSRPFYWLDAGIGLAWDFSTGIGYLSEHNLFIARYEHAEPSSGFTDGSYSTTKRQLSELGILYGYAFNRDFLNASLSGGVAAVWGDRFNGLTSEKYLTIGVPLETQVFLIPFPVLAFGGKALVDINGRQSYSSIAFCIRIGRLRYVSLMSK